MVKLLLHHKKPANINANGWLKPKHTTGHHDPIRFKLLFWISLLSIGKLHHSSNLQDIEVRPQELNKEFTYQKKKRTEQGI